MMHKIISYSCYSFYAQSFNGLTLIDVKLEVMPLERMRSILNNSDHPFVNPTRRSIHPGYELHVWVATTNHKVSDLRTTQLETNLQLYYIFILFSLFFLSVKCTYFFCLPSTCPLLLYISVLRSSHFFFPSHLLLII